MASRRFTFFAGVPAAVSYSLETKLFLTCSGIPTEASGTGKAIGTFIDTMVRNDLYQISNLYIWPMVGGTETAHACEMRGVENLTFFNMDSSNHTDNGINWNDTDEYARTGIIMQDHYTEFFTTVGLMIPSGTTFPLSQDNFGARRQNFRNCVGRLHISGSATRMHHYGKADPFNGEVRFIHTGSFESVLMLSVRSGSNYMAYYIDGINHGINSASNTGEIPDRDMQINGRNDFAVGGPQGLKGEDCCGFMMGPDLTDSQIKTLSTAFTQLQVNLPNRDSAV